MEPTLEAVFGRNITLVYTSIDLSLIDPRIFKDIFRNSEPAIIQIPDTAIIFTSQSDPSNVHIDKKRVLINFPLEIEKLGDFPISEFAVYFNDRIKSDSQKLIAYGFNFDFGFNLNTDASKRSVELFSPNTEIYKNAFEGRLVEFFPTFTLENIDIRYTYSFAKHSDQQIKVHVNVHHKNTELPEEKELTSVYIKEFENALSSTIRLLTQ